MPFGKLTKSFLYMDILPFFFFFVFWTAIQICATHLFLDFLSITLHKRLIHLLHTLDQATSQMRSVTSTCFKPERTLSNVLTQANTGTDE